MTPKLFEIIYEDAGLLVVNKPAGLVCHPTKTDEYSSLVSRARLYLGQGSHPQLVNRLDRETSGVALIAKDPDSARALRRLWESRQVRKEYLAIVHGRPAQEHGIIDGPLGKDERSRVAIKDCVRPDGAPAQTEYWLIQEFSKTLMPAVAGGSAEVRVAAAAQEQERFSLLRVMPRTGRKHQIRIHPAYLGHPIVGDKLYGADEDLYLALVENRLTAEDWRRLILPHHALHAQSVCLAWYDAERLFQAEPEPWFTGFLIA